MKSFEILCVEDDRSVLNLLSITLKMHEYAYYTASTGQDALAMMTSHKPDLVLMDLGLPDTDGLEVIRTIRS